MSQAVVSLNAGMLLPVLAPAIGAAVVLVVDVAAPRLRRRSPAEELDRFAKLVAVGGAGRDNGVGPEIVQDPIHPTKASRGDADVGEREAGGLSASDCELALYGAGTVVPFQLPNNPRVEIRQTEKLGLVPAAVLPDEDRARLGNVGAASLLVVGRCPREHVA